MNAYYIFTLERIPGWELLLLRHINFNQRCLPLKKMKDTKLKLPRVGVEIVMEVEQDIRWSVTTHVCFYTAISPRVKTEQVPLLLHANMLLLSVSLYRVYIATTLHPYRRQSGLS